MAEIKAAVCRAFNSPLTLEAVTLRAPNSEEVEIDIAACAICHSDISFIDGIWGGNLPSVFGHEAAGTVRSIGADVTGYQVGEKVLVTLLKACGSCPSCSSHHPADCEAGFDRVAGSPITDASGAKIEQGMNAGAFAERVVVDQSQIAKLPQDMDMVSASLLACGALTGVGAVVNAAQVKIGSTVAVIGAGGVGLNAIQGARLSEAKTIIAVDLDQGKLDQAKEFGATDGVLATSESLPEDIKAMTEGRGVDYVFVTVGVVAVYQQALSYLAPRAELVMVGMPPVGAEMSVEPVNIAASSQVLRGTKMGDAKLDRDVPKLVTWYEAGELKLDEMVAGTFRLDQINEAIAATKSGAAGRNVIVFDKT